MQVKLNGWQLSTLVFASLFAGSLCTHGHFSSIAEAAPADVKGSGNVAVCGYKTKGGSFVLFSNGKIVSIPAETGKTPQVVVANAMQEGEYLPAPSELKIPVEDRATKGSPNVAIGIVPTASGTYVLFANGDLRRPKNDPAAAGPPEDLVSGFVTGVDARSQGCTISYPTGKRQETSYVKFDTPFSSIPAVSVSAISGEAAVSVISIDRNGMTIRANYASYPTPQGGYSWVVTSTEKAQ